MRNPLKGLFQTKSIGIHRIDGLSGFEHLTDSNNLNSYKDSLYLYIGVSMIMKRVAGIPLELYKIKNKKGDVAEVFDHPLLDVLNNPNSFQSAREFWELSVSHYLLSGDCFWLLERNGTKIVQMMVLRPDYVEVALSNDGKTIVGYDYRFRTVQRFKPENVLHIRNTDPTNPLRGVGVVRPARSRILTEIEATAYQASFFKNQGRPDFAVFADADVDEEKAADFRARWKAVFGGKNAGSVGIFGRNVKSVQELNKTPKEMDFIASQHFLRDDILAALRIPKAMVTSDDVNLANAKEAYRVFLQEAVTPVFEAFLDVINTKLVPAVDDSVFFDFTDPAPVDREMLLKETRELKTAGIITANEARAMYNYDALDGGDTLSASPQATQALTETAKRFIRKRPLLAKKLEATEAMALVILNSQPKRQLNSIFPDQKSKLLYAKAVNDRADRKAEKVKKDIDVFHEGMMKRVLESDLTVDGFMDKQAEKKTAKDFFTPIMVKLYNENGQEALDALFRKASAEHFFADAVLLAAIEGRVEFFTASIVDTTFEVLKSQIIEGVKEGYGVDKIAKNIRDTFDNISKNRAKTIAQTETNFVLSKSTNDAYAQSSVVTGKEWLTVGDDKVRPEHVENNGKIVAKGGTFPSGESYPAEHSVNCRCILLPTV